MGRCSSASRVNSGGPPLLRPPSFRFTSSKRPAGFGQSAAAPQQAPVAGGGLGARWVGREGKNGFCLPFCEQTTSRHAQQLPLNYCPTSRNRSDAEPQLAAGFWGLSPFTRAETLKRGRSACTGPPARPGHALVLERCKSRYPASFGVRQQKSARRPLPRLSVHAAGSSTQQMVYHRMGLETLVLGK